MIFTDKQQNMVNVILRDPNSESRLMRLKEYLSTQKLNTEHDWAYIAFEIFKDHEAKKRQY
jgi:hypothetical protein